MKSEKISSEIAPQYGVYDIAHYVQDNQNLEIDQIVIKCANNTNAILMGRKFNQIDGRFFCQEGAEASAFGIAALFRRTTGIKLESGSAACSIAGTVLQVAGIQVGAILGQYGAAQVCTATSKYFDNGVSAEKQILDFTSQRYQRLEGDLSQQIQAAEKGMDQAYASVDRQNQNERSLAEKITQ